MSSQPKLTADELAKVTVKLIDILLNSCTEYAGDIEEHEHKLFDNIDVAELNKLKELINVDS